MSGTTRPLVALVTDGLSASGKQALQRSGWMLLEVGLIGHEGQDMCQPFEGSWLLNLPEVPVDKVDLIV